MKNKITIEFGNQKSAKYFALWLSRIGDQEYWNWMENVEQKEKGNITAVSFNFNGLNGIGAFMADQTIRCEAGRLDRDE